MVTPHRFNQFGGKRYTVLDTGVHPLPAGWTVHMRRIAAKKDPALMRGLGNAMVNVEARTPHDVVHAPRVG